MRFQLYALILSAPVAIATSACGSDPIRTAPDTIDTIDTTHTDNPPAANDAGADVSASTLAITTFCEIFAERLCDAIAPCACDTASPCRATQTARCEMGLSSLIGGVALGAIDFRPVEAARCIDDTASFAATCGLPTARAQPLPCATYLVDPATMGTACSTFGRGLRCADGAGYCRREDGTCTALAHEGACDSRLACADDRVCVGGTCLPIGGDGDGCESHDACAATLVCRQNGTCGLPGGADTPCTNPGQCDRGLACIDGRCRTALSLGAPCTDDICGANATCVAPDSRTCQAIGRTGDTCSGGERDCDAGLQCDFTRVIPTCQPLPALGEPCPTGSCARGFTCNYATSTCIAAPGPGQNCLNETSRPCAEGFVCGPDLKTCVAAGEVGQPCVGLGNACGEGLHCDLSGTTPTCRGPGSEGYACGWNTSHCQDSLFCDTTTNACRPFLALGLPCDTDAACGPAGRCDFGTSPALCVPAPATVGEACDWMCGNGLRCAPSTGECTPGACQFLR